MIKQERIQEIKAFIDEYVPSLPKEKERDLAEILYSMGESGMWIDNVDSVSLEQATLIYSVVAAIQAKTFPQDLSM